MPYASGKDAMPYASEIFSAPQIWAKINEKKMLGSFHPPALPLMRDAFPRDGRQLSLKTATIILTSLRGKKFANSGLNTYLMCADH